MAELGKVIRGLRCLSNPYIQDMDERDCENCQYDNSCCFLDVTADALSLLKAQEPRVMTVEDAKQAEAGTVVWLEWRIESKINSAFFFRLINKGIDDSLEFHVLDGFVAARLACYGTEWRCWTSRPTDEQREATPWSEPPKEET